MQPLGPAGPVAGGIDLDLPGNGVRLRATRWPGAGPPVLLLHGLASQRRFWNLVVPGLVGRDGPAVLALDQRGHGDSEQPATGYDTETVVSDALTALDSLGLSRVVVVGHSWGATVALALAAAHPERTLAVVAIDGGFAAMPADAPREAVRARLEPPRFAVPPEQLTGRVRAGPLGGWWSPAVAAAVLPIFGVGDDGLARPRFRFDNHMQVVDALLDSDPAAVLSRVSCPAWLVDCVTPGPGGDPAWVAAKARSFELAGHLLAQPRLLRWSGALHDVPLQWPALVSGLIRSAADEVAPRAGTSGGISDMGGAQDDDS
ncbi:MAG: hypothetical protein NVSMB13_09370 [Mycobacteriales bacterium]